MIIRIKMLALNWNALLTLDKLSCHTVYKDCLRVSMPVSWLGQKCQLRRLKWAKLIREAQLWLAQLCQGLGWSRLQAKLLHMAVCKHLSFPTCSLNFLPWLLIPQSDQLWWGTPPIPALGWLRQKDHLLRLRPLDYRVRHSLNNFWTWRLIYMAELHLSVHFHCLFS